VILTLDLESQSKDQPIPDISRQIAPPGIRIPHLKLIVSLDDYGQISAAASVLNMSQPAASRMLSEMEAALDAPLCERQSRGVRLTAYGKAFARRARLILRELDEANREISDLRDGTGGSVFLGAVTAPAVQIIVPAIQKIRLQFPRINISVAVETSNILARDLLTSRFDFILARIPEDMSTNMFTAQQIGVEKACLVMRKDHPLAGHPRVDISELTECDWVFQLAGSLLNRSVEKIFLAKSAKLPERIVNTSSLLMTLVMVRETDAIAPMALDVAKRFVQNTGDGTLAIVPLGFHILVEPFSLISMRGRQLSPAATTVHQIILNEAMSQNNPSKQGHQNL
jgi:DNA-binding transcriptional LysR family regulator